jgi:hypothetical protein
VGFSRGRKGTWLPPFIRVRHTAGRGAHAKARAWRRRRRVRHGHLDRGPATDRLCEPATRPGGGVSGPRARPNLGMFIFQINFQCEYNLKKNLEIILNHEKYSKIPKILGKSPEID